MRVRFYAKRPGGGRASYAILRDVVRDNGTRESKLVKDERLVALNHAYKAGLKGAGECEIELQVIIESLYKSLPDSAPAAFHEDNEKLFRAFWRAEYEKRQLTDPQSARNGYQRALRELGGVSLISGSEKAIAAKLKHLKGNKQRRIATSLNTLLTWAHRDFRIPLHPLERRRVRHLSFAEFEKVQEKITDERLELLYTTLFGTGARVGEAFAIQPEDFRGKDTLRIHSQLTRDEILTQTKNRRERTVVIHPKCIDAVRKWAALPNREDIRHERFAEIIQEQAQRAFPSHSIKWVTAHDLRHSYAIYLLNQGVSMGLVAQSLANSVQVCQEYYAGFELSPQGIAEIQSLVRRKRKRP